MSNPENPNQNPGYGQQSESYPPPPGAYPPSGGYQQPGGGYPPPPGSYQQPYQQPGYGPPPGNYPPPGYAPPGVYQQPYNNYAPAMGVMGTPKANFGQRFISYLIDGFIMGILFYIPIVIFGLIGAGTADKNRDVLGDVTDAGAATAGGLIFAGVLVGLILALAYYVILIAKGQTLGNKAAGMKFVTAEGTPPGFGKAFVRMLVQYFVSGIFLIGYLWVFWDENQQTLHDKAAGIFAVPSRQ